MAREKKGFVTFLASITPEQKEFLHKLAGQTKTLSQAEALRCIIDRAMAMEDVETKLADMDVLIQAADHLAANGGGPMEDRLRLLHAQLVELIP